MGYASTFQIDRKTFVSTAGIAEEIFFTRITWRFINCFPALPDTIWKTLSGIYVRKFKVEHIMEGRLLKETTISPVKNKVKYINIPPAPKLYMLNYKEHNCN